VPAKYLQIRCKICRDRTAARLRGWAGSQRPYALTALTLLAYSASVVYCHMLDGVAMKIPVCLVLLVAITFICTPQAAVLAKEAIVVQLRLHGTYEDTLPPENPFGPRLLHFKGLFDLIREATTDQNIAALYLKSESPRLGLAKVRELVQALQEFKA